MDLHHFVSGYNQLLADQRTAITPLVAQSWLVLVLLGVSPPCIKTTVSSEIVINVWVNMMREDLSIYLYAAPCKWLSPTRNHFWHIPTHCRKPVWSHALTIQALLTMNGQRFSLSLKLELNMLIFNKCLNGHLALHKIIIMCVCVCEVCISFGAC